MLMKMHITFAMNGARSMHGPGDARGVTLRHHGEFGGVARFEGLHEMQGNDDLGRWRRLRDLHPPLADLVIPLPFVDRALAALRAAIAPLERRVDLLIGRPGDPVVEVVDQGKDLLRRRLDPRRPLHAESIGPGRREEEKYGDHNDDNNQDDDNGGGHEGLR